MNSNFDDDFDDEELRDKEIEIKLEISKKVSGLNKPVTFTDEPAKILEEVLPNNKLTHDYIDLDPLHRSVQCSSEISEHYVNTERAEYTSQGMNHIEGGWPKDINPMENDQTMRFRKKVEKDDNYIHSVLNLCQAMESCIRQNTAIEIYQDYFESMDESTKCEKPKAQSVHVFRDPSKTIKRPISSISWRPDGGSRIAIAYCNMEFQATHPDTPKESYTFQIEDPTHPETTIHTPSYLVNLEYNPKDLNILAGGCYNGQVGVWDTRKGGNPEGLISLEHSHTDPVTKTLWLNSKSAMEFFTSSTDGNVKWWDIRKFTEPTEVLVLDTSKDPDIRRAHGASCLEFESTIPTKFMVGTDRGCVFSCNKKAKVVTEKIVSVYNAHFGPVYALQRNPCFPKNFLTVGDWCARIWSEDIKESSIMWTSSYTENLTDGCWSPTRPSVFFTTRMDGCLDSWDILYQQRAPILSVKVADEPLHCLRVHEGGCLVTVGCEGGNAVLLELSECLASSQRNDKSSVTSMFERETRREKILETRNKELRLKEKTKGILGLGGGPTSTVTIGTGSGGAFGSLAKHSISGGIGEEESENEEEEPDEMNVNSTAAKHFPKDEAILKAELDFFQILKEEQDNRVQNRKIKADTTDSSLEKAS
ncbi:dynein intermediate chain 3, ciliary isoform X2 [Lepeophtheirus salmonis]|uniref:dynein intermediate chain 3, ciliary isoform X2 n=1 Tax=Lepeophtheirus salmonis TaxID=72036 RepID=UPI003AF3690E